MAEITKVKEASAVGPAVKKMKHPDATIPSYVGQTITSLLVFIMAATMRGTAFFKVLGSCLYERKVYSSVTPLMCLTPRK